MALPLLQCFFFFIFLLYHVVCGNEVLYKKAAMSFKSTFWKPTSKYNKLIMAVFTSQVQLC